jgi:hypothetical protein
MAGRGGGWKVVWCLLLLAAPLLTAGQDEEVEEGFACPMEVELPRCPSAAAVQLQPCR